MKATLTSSFLFLRSLKIVKDAQSTLLVLVSVGMCVFMFEWNFVHFNKRYFPIVIYARYNFRLSMLLFLVLVLVFYFFAFPKHFIEFDNFFFKFYVCVKLIFRQGCVKVHSNEKKWKKNITQICFHIFG